MSVKSEILTITNSVVLSHIGLRDIVLITRWRNEKTSCATSLLGLLEKWNWNEKPWPTKVERSEGPQTKQSRRQSAPLSWRRLSAFCLISSAPFLAMIQNDLSTWQSVMTEPQLWTYLLWWWWSMVNPLRYHLFLFCFTNELGRLDSCDEFQRQVRHVTRCAW